MSERNMWGEPVEGRGVRDYHDFTNIDTPREERRALDVGDIWINAAKCEVCGDTIRSRNRHDLVTCSCGNLSVDGGSWYAKRSFRDSAMSFTDLTENFRT